MHQFCERNSNGWVAVFQTECCGFKSRRSLQIFHRRVVSTGKTSVSKTEVLRSNRSVPANFQRESKEQKSLPHFSPIFSLWKISLIGKAVVLKTIAHLSLAGSSPASSAILIWDVGFRIWDFSIRNPTSQISNPLGGVAQRNQSSSLRTNRLEVQVLSPSPFCKLFRGRPTD